MDPPRSRTRVGDLQSLCRIAGWLCTIGIIVLSLVPGDRRPHSGVAPGQVEHLFAYLLAAGLLSLGYSGRTARLLVCMLLIALAALLEVVQIWIPGRNAEFIGFAGSALGTLLGCAGAFIRDIYPSAHNRRT